MTTEPWAQTTRGVLIIQGLIGPVVGAVVGGIITLVITQSGGVNWIAVLLVGVGIALFVFLVFSVFASGLRRIIWGSVRKFFRWLFAMRLTTKSGRDTLEEKGYQRRCAEVAEERRLSPRPTWWITHQDDDNFVFLRNKGYWVEDVTVRADSELFVFADGASEGFIKGRHAGNMPGESIGKQVPGELTREGIRRGVTFDLSWTDQNGDRQPETGGSDLLSTVSLPAKPLKKVIRPAWQIGIPREKSAPEVLMLVNGADGCVVKNVVIDADPNFFTFVLKRELGDLEGLGALRFAGRPTSMGSLHGVDFAVTYEDVNGDEHTDHVPEKFGMKVSF